MGAYAHLIFPTERFRSHTRDLALIDAYDALVYREQEFIGLEKYGKMFHNRMCFTVMYTSYMYPPVPYGLPRLHTHWPSCVTRRASPPVVLGVLHTRSALEQPDAPRPQMAGHNRGDQQYSLAIQTTVYGQPSRIQTENMGDTATPNRYTKAWSGIVVKRAPHSTEGDVFAN